MFGWHSRAAIVSDLDALKALRAPMTDKLAATALADIKADQALADFARAQGRSAFGDNCAPCHGAGGGGAKGYPNLNDDDWLWGGTLDEIQQTIEFGVRSGHAKAHESQMPAFGRDGMLKRDEIVDGRRTTCARSPACRRVRAPISRRARSSSPTIARSVTATTARATRSSARPNLTDAIWLYGSDEATIIEVIANCARRRDAGLGRPARPMTIKALTVLRPLARRRGEVIRDVPRTTPGRPRARTRSAGCSRWRAAPRSSRAAGRRRRSIRRGRMADDAPLYAARRKIYPQRVSGTYRRIKWAVLFVTLGIYYFLPFVRWDRGPNAPDQAVLIDLPNSRFYFFFIEIWPQEVYYFTGLLIIAAMALFLMNAVAGRIWCGYLCPQTVWTDLFQTIERWCEGDRREHLQRDQGGWTAERVARARRQALPLADGRVVDRRRLGALFRRRADAGARSRDLARAVRRLSVDRHPDLHDLYARRPHARAGLPLHVPVAAHPGGADRRARAQRHLSLRSRRAARLGEEGDALRAQGLPAGDCIDCLQCVHVCPTGVDIRNGPNLDCIQCGLCIDACDAVMTKIGRPTRLIAYDTDLNIQRRQEGRRTSPPLRPPAHGALCGDHRGWSAA